MDREVVLFLAAVGAVAILFFCVRAPLPGFRGQRGPSVMTSSVAADVDFIEELRLRRWARENYVPASQRQLSWHPVILDEMYRKDFEVAEVEAVVTCA